MALDKKKESRFEMREAEGQRKDFSRCLFVLWWLHIGRWITSPLASLRPRSKGLPTGQSLLKIRAFFLKAVKGCKKKASVWSKNQDFMVYPHG